MIEMVLAEALRRWPGLLRLPEALQHFFTYIARTDFREQIVFSDYYLPHQWALSRHGANHRSGERRKQRRPALYRANADAIVEAAIDAGDAIDTALAAPNKQLTVAYWQKVFGSTFQV